MVFPEIRDSAGNRVQREARMAKVKRKAKSKRSPAAKKKSKAIKVVKKRPARRPLAIVPTIGSASRATAVTSP